MTALVISISFVLRIPMEFSYFIWFFINIVSSLVKEKNWFNDDRFYVSMFTNKKSYITIFNQFQWAVLFLFLTKHVNVKIVLSLNSIIFKTIQKFILLFSLLTDTFENDVLQDRAVAQVKTFCDKGADRKSRYQTYFVFRHFLLPLCKVTVEA
jgi:hypothetical protein